MENPSQKCEICAEAGPNQSKLPRHYIRMKFKAETDMFIYLTRHVHLFNILDTADVCLSTVIRLFLAYSLPYVYLQLSSRVHTVCSIYSFYLIPDYFIVVYSF